jgi:hypothetical protein
MLKAILVTTLLVTLMWLPRPSSATDAVGPGLISDLTYREGYLMFQLVSGGVNACGPCPGDPGHFTGGGFCWIAQTQTVQIAAFLEAKALCLVLSGRVNGLTTDCTVYQMSVSDN